MSLVDISSVKTVCSIGGGPIGAGWAAFFLSKGFLVKAYLHSEKEKEDFLSMIDTAWISLEKLNEIGHINPHSVQINTDLDNAVKDVQFIQESAPENLTLKQQLYAHLGNIVPSEVVICSSTSGLTMTEIQANCLTAERTVVAHPFNPPYLLPLVEIVGGEKTNSDAVIWSRNFYEHIGKAPLVMNKEIPGFVATRLQEALWREALHMVANNEATPEEIDKALINGPGPRMAIQGQCLAFHVACGEGGMATNLDQFGPALKLPWTRLAAPELTQKLRDSMVSGCNNMTKGKDFQNLSLERDKKIVEIMKIQKMCGL
tara:strand:+ start:447 stop:1394 length:948 start_codon:yes stop_codon:yes gene_type:complete